MTRLAPAVRLILFLTAGCAASTPVLVQPTPPPSPEERSPPKVAAAAHAPAKAPAARQAPKTTAPAPVAQIPAVAHPPEAAPVAAKPTAPTLDLKTLEDRLGSTNSIGVLTKLAIRNQVNDLLDDFRAYHEGKGKASLGDLRRSYDLLVMKVLGLVQDEDQPLATAVASSREAIWGMLMDRNAFAKI